MPEQATPLPFFFRELAPSGRVVISNFLGAHATLSTRKELDALVKGDLSAFSSKGIEELFAKNFVAESGEQKTRASLLASGLATSIARATSHPGLFMVVPTLRCDHDCRYCQVSRAPLDARGFDASHDRIGAILNHIKAVAGQALKIEFQGGEPLLAFEFIRSFVVEADAALAGKNVSYVICSALGPMNDDVIEWAKDRNVVFSVSLDGGAAVHGTNRPSRYFDSFQNTREKIRDLQLKLGRERVACVATVTKSTLDRPYDLVDTYFDLGLDSLFVRPLAPFGFAAHLKRTLTYDADQYAKFFARLLDRVIESNADRTFVEESTLVRLRRIFDPGFSGYVDMQSPAGFLLGALVFNYDGRVFGSDEARMLWESTKASELVLGTVEDSPASIRTNSFAARLLEDTFTCTAPGCDECAYQPFCGADPLHHLSAQGDHVGNKALSFFCQVQRALFDQLFALLEDRPDARRVFESWLHR